MQTSISPAGHPVVPLRLKLGFASGQIAGQIFRDTPSLLLLFYLTSIVGIEPAVAGAAIFIPKVFWGALSDLGVGLASDRFNGRFPRRHWLLIGAFAAPSAMVLLFHAPQGSQMMRLGYVVSVFALYMMAFATFSVPFLAQFSEITADPRQRTTLLAWRHSFTGIGLLIGSGLTPAAIQFLGSGRVAYGQWSWALGAICAASLLTAWRSAPKIAATKAAAAGERLTLTALLGVLGERRYRVLLSVAFLQLVGAGMSYAGIAFFMTYNMKRPDALLQLGVITLIMAVIVVCGSPMWVWVSRRLGKKQTYLLAASVHGVVQCAWGLSSGAPMPVIYLYAAAIGLLNAGWGIMSLTMLADIIARSKAETGRDQAGSFSAIWALAEKIGLALGGTLLAGLVLSASGFTVAAAHSGALTAHALMGIAVVFSFSPGFANLAAAALFWRFGQPADDSRPGRDPAPLPIPELQGLSVEI